MNVTSLEPVKPEAHPGIVHLLEDLLEDAKRGEILSFAAAFVRTNNETGAALFDDWWQIRLLGEMRYLEHKLIDNLRKLNGDL